MKNLLHFVGCLLISLSTFAQNEISSTTQTTPPIYTKGIDTPKMTEMPNFKFYDLEGNVVSKQTLQYRNYLTFIFYDTDCSHCHKQAEQIASHLKKFKKSQILWVTIGEDDQIRAFQEKYFAKLPNNVLFVNDRDMNIFEAYNGTVTETPTIIIYNEAKQEIARMYETPVEKIYSQFK